MSIHTTLRFLATILLLGCAGPYVTVVVAQRLIAYYPFNGNADDQTGKGHNGTINNATPIKDRFGNLNSAYRFTPQSYIEVADAPDLTWGTTANFTVGAWVKLTGPQIDFAGIVVKGPRDVDYPGLQMVIMDNDKYMSEVSESNGAHVRLTGSKVLGDCRWHFVTSVVSTSTKTFSIYIDGQLAGSATSDMINVALNSTQPLLIGVDRNHARWFRGAIDDIRIYDGALSASQIDSLFHLGGWTGNEPAILPGKRTEVTICPKTSTRLDEGEAESYLWANGSTQRSINVSQSGNYLVNVVRDAECIQDTFTVKVGSGLSIPAQNMEICKDSSVTIGAIASGGTPPYTYLWSPAATLSSAITATPVASPTTTTIYKVDVEDADGCVGHAEVTVTVNLPPVVVASGAQTICRGDQALLNATVSGGTGARTYVWSPAAGLDGPNLPSPKATPLSTTTYRVTVTAGGCSASDSMTVFVREAPVAGSKGDQVICQGGSTPLYGEANGGTPPYSYTWTPSAGLSSTSIASPIATPGAVTRYTLIVTDANGCRDSTHVTVSVRAGPRVQASISQIICRGDTVVLRPNVTGGSGAYSYAWGTDTSLSSTVVPTPSAFPSASTVYHFTVTDGNGCTASDSVRVIVSDPPRASAGGDMVLCSGATVRLNGSASGGSAPYRFRWSPGSGLSATDIPAPFSTPDTTTTYTLVVIDANGCRDSSTMKVIVEPAGLLMIPLIGDSLVRIDTTELGSDRCDSVRVRNVGRDTLALNGMSMIRNIEFSVPPHQSPMRIAPGEERWIEICYRPKAAGEDNDTLSLQSLCDYRIAIRSAGRLPVVHGTDRCGASINILPGDISAAMVKLGRPYPNPSGEIVTIDLEKTAISGSDGPMERCLLYDAMGRVVREGTYRRGRNESSQVERGSFDIDLSGLPQGFYAATVVSVNGRVTMPVVVLR